MSRPATLTVAETVPNSFLLAVETRGERPALREKHLGIWQSIVAPADTPRDVVTKLHGSIRKVLAAPDVREKLANAGIEPASSNTPEEFAAFIRSQAETRAKVIQAVGMKLD